MTNFHRYNRSAEFFCHKLRKAGYYVRFDFVDDEWFAGVEVREGRFYRVVGCYSTPRAAYNSIFGTRY